MPTFQEIVSHLDAKQPVSARMRAIFGLKGLGDEASVRALEKSLREDPSALVRHEVAYVLGQMKALNAVPTLRTTLCDTAEDVMVRHEAGEALGAIGDMSALPLLQEFAANAGLPREIRETCVLAAERLQRQPKRIDGTGEGDGEGREEMVGYGTVDPAFPLQIKDTGIENREEKQDVVVLLRKTLCNGDIPLYERYAALFALRDYGGKSAILALCDAMEMETNSALFRHEVAYVLGQIASPLAIPSLSRILQRTDENYMVRHEAAEALGAIASEDAKHVLWRFVEDQADVVRESVEVALDIAGYVTSDAVEYADTLSDQKEGRQGGMGIENDDAAVNTSSTKEMCNV